jgi:GNAT superfamily N-acetyltransferase
MLIETPPVRLGRFEPDLVAVRRGIAKAVAAGESWLDAENTTAILAAYGITVAQPRAGGTGAAELFAGLVEDPVFGPLVAFGQAGAAVGILHDTSDLPMRWPSRLSQLDYDWELALLAVHEGAALGVVRYSADPGREKAEYAIAVRSDWKGRGLGWLLMTRLIAIARQRGVGELVGEVLRENEPMLQMCREFGFAITPEPGDTAVLRVSKRLVSSGRSAADRPTL